MGIRGRALKVGDEAVTDYNGPGALARVLIVEADYTKRHGHSQSGTMFRVTPPLKNGTAASWYDADWFEPAPPQPKTADLVTGYRQLSEAEVALMNEGKALAEACGEYIAKLRQHPSAHPMGRNAPTAPGDLPTLDQRWVSIGATDIQRGFMAVIRGIAQPTTF